MAHFANFVIQGDNIDPYKLNNTLASRNLRIRIGPTDFDNDRIQQTNGMRFELEKLDTYTDKTRGVWNTTSGVQSGGTNTLEPNYPPLEVPATDYRTSFGYVVKPPGFSTVERQRELKSIRNSVLNRQTPEFYDPLTEVVKGYHVDPYSGKASVLLNQAEQDANALVNNFNRNSLAGFNQHLHRAGGVDKFGFSRPPVDLDQTRYKYAFPSGAVGDLYRSPHVAKDIYQQSRIAQDTRDDKLLASSGMNKRYSFIFDTAVPTTYYVYPAMSIGLQKPFDQITLKQGSSKGMIGYRSPSMNLTLVPRARDETRMEDGRDGNYFLDTYSSKMEGYYKSNDAEITLYDLNGLWLYRLSPNYNF